MFNKIKKFFRMFARTSFGFIDIVLSGVNVYNTTFVILFLALVQHVLAVTIDFTGENCSNFSGIACKICEVAYFVEKGHMNPVQVISTFLVSLLVFLIPLILQFFDTHIRNNLGDSEIIFEIFKKHSKIRDLSYLLFAEISFLYLQNAYDFWDLGMIKHWINTIMWFVIVFQSAKILNNYILCDSRINLVFSLYEYALEKDLFSKRKILFSIFNNMKYLVESNNIEGLREFDRKLIKLLKNHDGDETFEILNNSSPVLRSLIQESILKIKNDNYNFFDELISLFLHIIYYFDNYSTKKIFTENMFSIFYELNAFVWRENINLNSDYIKSSYLRNKKDKKTFDYSCSKIYSELEEIKFIDLKKEEYLQYFDYIYNPFLNTLLKIISYSIEEGNEDAIDNFLDMLITFPNNNIIFRVFDDFSILEKAKLLDIENFKNRNIKFTQKDKDEFYDEYKNMYDNEEEFSKYIFCSSLKNYWVDITIDLFAFLSYKHYELEENTKETFAIKVAGKILYGEVNEENNFDLKITKPLSNFEDLFSSVMRSFCIAQSNELKDKYLEQYLDCFNDLRFLKNPSLIRDELIKFKSIILIVKYKNIDFENYFNIMFDLNKSYRKINDIIFNLNDLIEIIRNLNFADYYNSYIKFLFDEDYVTEPVFIRNSKELVVNLENMIKYFSEKIEKVEERKNIYSQKIDYIENFILENYEKNITNETYYKIFKNNPNDKSDEFIREFTYSFSMEKNSFIKNRQKRIILYNSISMNFYGHFKTEIIREIYNNFYKKLRNNSKIMVNTSLKDYFLSLKNFFDKDKYIFFKNKENNNYISVFESKNKNAIAEGNFVIINTPFKNKEVILSNNPKFNNLIICIDKRSFNYFDIIPDSLKVNIDGIEDETKNKITITFKVKYYLNIDSNVELHLFSYDDKK